MSDSFKAKSSLKVGDKSYTYCNLKALEPQFKLSRLPYSYKILLENLVRHEDGVNITKADVEALAGADLRKLPQKEIAFMPARVVLQDFTGVPCVVDFAAMRDAMKSLGGDAKKINPLCPAELVIDHSVMVDHYGTSDAFDLNAKLEFQRNKERYSFLRWGQEAFDNFKVVPPDTGIVHQVNIEFLARVVFDKNGLLYPDSCFGTDSHTTMVNGIGVLGWGVGGIEAEACLLGQPLFLLTPVVVGVRFHNALPPGVTATDLVLTLTELLRKHGVVGKFVEFCGTGLSALTAADRATMSNMSPEFGATASLFPVDAQTLRYLRESGRDPGHVDMVERYCREQGMFRTDEDEPPCFSEMVELDLASVEPSLAGPSRPQDRVALSRVGQSFRAKFGGAGGGTGNGTVAEELSTLESEGGSPHPADVVRDRKSVV